MLRLIARGEEVYAWQRSMNIPDLQNRSHDVVTKGAAEWDSSKRSALRQYTTFCHNTDVPPYPITSSMAALCLFAKCSARNGYYATFHYQIMSISKVVQTVWDGQPVFQELPTESDAKVGVKEFMAERKAARERGELILRPGKQPAKRVREESVESTDDHEDSDYQPLAIAPASVEAAEVEAVQQLTCPDFPRLDQHFSSLDKLYGALVLAVMPVYGIGLIIWQGHRPQIKCNRSHEQHRSKPGGCCPWTVVVEKTEQGRWAILESLSTLYHTHGPDPRIVADPAWRPTVKNAVARAVLGMRPLGSTTQSKKENKPPLAKKPRTEPSSAYSTPAPSTFSGSTASYAPSPSLALSSDSRHFLPSPALPASPDFPLPPLPPAPGLSISSSSSSAPTAPYSQSPQIATPHAPPHALASSSAPSTASPLSNDALSSFLAALHPSLASLAPYLPAIGVTSPSSLADLTLFEPSTLDALLELVVQVSEDDKTRPVGAAKVSLVQLKMFARALRDAKKSGWAA
ncbi:hypothetical protein JCM10207_007096 [Rhodosporidiobolus poonsookiae]